MLCGRALEKVGSRSSRRVRYFVDEKEEEEKKEEKNHGRQRRGGKRYRQVSQPREERRSGRSSSVHALHRRDRRPALISRPSAYPRSTARERKDERVFLFFPLSSLVSAGRDVGGKPVRRPTGSRSSARKDSELTARASRQAIEKPEEKNQAPSTISSRTLSIKLRDREQKNV